jgi:hypothetical protein
MSKLALDNLNTELILRIGSNLALLHTLSSSFRYSKMVLGYMVLIAAVMLVLSVANAEQIGSD